MVRKAKRNSVFFPNIGGFFYARPGCVPSGSPYHWSHHSEVQTGFIPPPEKGQHTCLFADSQSSS